MSLSLEDYVSRFARLFQYVLLLNSKRITFVSPVLQDVQLAMDKDVLLVQQRLM